MLRAGLDEQLFSATVAGDRSTLKALECYLIIVVCGFIVGHIVLCEPKVFIIDGIQFYASEAHFFLGCAKSSATATHLRIFLSQKVADLVKKISCRAKK